MPDNNTQLQMLRQEIESLKAELYRGNFSGSQDFNKYTRFNTRLKVPNYSVAPAKCEVGEIIEVGGKLKICSAANTWTTVGTQV
jgi:hypothetical protein